jgi:molybdopterin-guanine dinucleotide biosynthesis protein A
LNDPASRTAGRIANVTAAVFVEQGFEGDAAAFASELERLFEEVLVIHPDAAPEKRTPGSVRGPLDRLVATLSAATKDRVLVVGSSHGRPPTALVLALTAWPERDAVMPFRNGRPDPLCAIYRRARVLDAAQEAIALGATALEDVLAGLDTGRVDGRDLVAIDPPREPA